MRRHCAFTLVELLVVIAILALLAAILFPTFSQAREKARQATCLSQLREFGMARSLYSGDYDAMFTPPFLYGRAGDYYVRCAETLQWWDDLLQPYLKDHPIALCPSRVAVQDVCSAPSTKWLSTPRGKTKPMSYGINTVEYWPLTPGWDSLHHHGFRDPDWAKDPPDLLQVGKPISEAVVEDMTGTIWIMDSSTVEMWTEEYFDYAPGQKRGFQRHHDGFNVAFADGHVRWFPAGTTRPCMWSVQDDCDADRR